MNKIRLQSLDLSPVKYGLGLVILIILINVGLGALFGLNEDMFQNYIHAGIVNNPALFSNPAKDQDVIWRMVQRAHFQAGGIGAFTLGLVILTALSDMSYRRKQMTSVLLGLVIFYPLAWFTMFLYAPSIGRVAAHHAPLVELLTDVGLGAFCLGLLSLIPGLFLPSKEA